MVENVFEDDLSTDKGWSNESDNNIFRDATENRVVWNADQEATRRLMVRLLSSLGSPPDGFESREARDGQEAVCIWHEWAPHLIWMDMRMPVMDGYEATRQIKAKERGRATVIVALTASAFDEDRVEILARGCDDFVRKPFRESEIFDKLELHLGVRFVYEDSVKRALSKDPDTQRIRTLKSLVNDAPAEWIAALHQAAAQADADLVLELVAEIQAGHELLAEGLTVHFFTVLGVPVSTSQAVIATPPTAATNRSLAPRFQARGTSRSAMRRESNRSCNERLPSWYMCGPSLPDGYARTTVASSRSATKDGIRAITSAPVRAGAPP